MVGKSAIVTADFNNGQGWVEVDGEIWQAYCAEPLLLDQRVTINDVAGLWLQVMPASETQRV